MWKNIICVGILLSPVFAFASVRVSEVAWMGAKDNANAEWFEIENPSDAPQDLTGITLEWNASHATLGTTTLSAHAFKVYYRSTDYTGALRNAGETLVLRQGSTTLETIDASAGWPAGDNETKQTMQWNPDTSVWVTATATPGSGLLAQVAQATSSDSTISDAPPAPSSHASPAPLLDVKEEHPLIIDAGRDRLGFVDSPLLFQAKGDPGTVTSWSMGDGAALDGSDISYAYSYPGDYVVVVNARRGSDLAVDRASVKIVRPDLALASVRADGAVEIANRGLYEMNLAGWKLAAGDQLFPFPVDTILIPGAHVIFPARVTKFALVEGSQVALLSPAGGAWSRAAREADPERVAALSSQIATAASMIQSLSQKVFAPRLPVLLLPPPRVNPAPPRLSAGSSPSSTTSPPALSRPQNFWSQALHFFGL